ncbi:hypothetical protein PHMEG_00020394 [Phytophthora megakarya]|uniref:HAT C-terminal dimerisation domain-containing protein n=1 Tax=Phytophthora megakarya TaxID=4795 RepID=A0A225VP07_9STRA|nr:hypothetical protein PHMEG_00020394 [Phytophthora megakarya]
MNDENSSFTSDKRQRLIHDFFEPTFSPEEKAEFERLLIQFQADNCLPDRFIEKLSTRRLFGFLNKAVLKALPGRITLGGRILDKHSAVVEESQFDVLRKRQVYSGGRVNFLSDVVQDISKSHLLGCQLGLFGTLANYGLYGTGSRHHGIAIANQMETAMTDIAAKGWKIGAVVTDNAGQCERARGILALRHPRIAYMHCMAHDTNNLVKAVLNSEFREITAQASLVTTTLNASSSKWLVEAKNTVKAVYGKAWGFINLCETRWNSMQGCFASLLRVRSGLRRFAILYGDSTDFPDALRVLYKPDFWQKLQSAEAVIRPLSNVSFKLQRDESTLADAIVAYRDIYIGFLHNLDNLTLVELVERRWRKCEQPLVLLALLLHPQHRQVAVAINEENPELNFLERLCGYGVYYYRRYCDSEDIDGLAHDLYSWYCGDFVDNKLVRFNGDVGLYWSFISDIRRQSKLPKLAVYILSIAISTATCERYFSELAAIHTAKKNRMKSEKVRKFALIRNAVRILDKLESGVCSDVFLKRIIEASERECIVIGSNVANDDDTTDNIAEIEERSVILHQDTPEDDVAEYWQDIYEVLDTGTTDDDIVELECSTELSQKIFNGVDDPIPQPDRTPFPLENDKKFPQEKKLSGIRGQKFSLATLFSTNRTFARSSYTTPQAEQQAEQQAFACN